MRNKMPDMYIMGNGAKQCIMHTYTKDGKEYNGLPRPDPEDHPNPARPEVPQILWVGAHKHGQCDQHRVCAELSPK